MEYATLGPTYLFIDGGHLRKNHERLALKWYRESFPIAWGSLKQLFCAEKMFYYDAPSDEDNVTGQEELVAAIKLVGGAHVRFGKLMGEGKNRRQKKVDILFAVDALNHANRKNMEHAVLLTGDGDFTPLVESLVQMGIFVTVAGTRPAGDLISEADHFHKLGIDFYCQITTAPEGKRPRRLDHRPMENFRWKLEATLGKSHLRFGAGNNGHVVRIANKLEDYIYDYDDGDELLRYVGIEFGEISWAPVGGK